MHVIFSVGIVLVCDYVHGGKGYLFEGGVGLLGGVGEKGGGSGVCYWFDMFDRLRVVLAVD